MDPITNLKKRQSFQKCSHIKSVNIIYLNGRLTKEDESDLRSDEHYVSGSENNAPQKYRLVRELNPRPLVISMQCSTN